MLRIIPNYYVLQGNKLNNNWTNWYWINRHSILFFFLGRKSWINIRDFSVLNIQLNFNRSWHEGACLHLLREQESARGFREFKLTLQWNVHKVPLEWVSGKKGIKMRTPACIILQLETGLSQSSACFMPFCHNLCINSSMPCQLLHFVFKIHYSNELGGFVSWSFRTSMLRIRWN